MGLNHLNGAFNKAKGPGLPEDDKPEYNRDAQLKAGQKKGLEAQRRYEALGYSTRGIKFSDKDK